MSSADEDLVVHVSFDLAASAVYVGVGVGTQGGDEEEGVEVGGVDAEAVLGVGGCAELFGVFDPGSGGSAASGDHDELVASLLQLDESVCVLGEGVWGGGEEASAEADGDSQGWVWFWVDLCGWVVWGPVLRFLR